RSTPPREERADPAQPFLDALDRRGVREAEIALGVAPEGDARRDHHVSLLEDLVGEAQRVAREVPGVGQDVEGARRLEAHAEAERAQAVDHEAAPRREDLAEARRLLRR